MKYLGYTQTEAGMLEPWRVLTELAALNALEREAREPREQGDPLDDWEGIV